MATTQSGKKTGVRVAAEAFRVHGPGRISQTRHLEFAPILGYCWETYSMLEV